MNYYFRVLRTPYEEPRHLSLRLEVTNGRQVAQFDFYVATSELVEWANHLEKFPRHPSDVFLTEIGSEHPEDKSAYYFRFRTFLTDSQGHCAIHLRVNNNRPLPDREISEFCISRIDPAQINDLGSVFRHFAKLEHEAFVWGPAGSMLYRTRQDAEEAGWAVDSETV